MPSEGAGSDLASFSLRRVNHHSLLQNAPISRACSLNEQHMRLAGTSYRAPKETREESREQTKRARRTSEQDARRYLYNDARALGEVLVRFAGNVRGHTVEIFEPGFQGKGGLVCRGRARTCANKSD
jgi:hypothetical protein